MGSLLLQWYSDSKPTVDKTNGKGGQLTDKCVAMEPRCDTWRVTPQDKSISSMNKDYWLFQISGAKQCNLQQLSFEKFRRKCSCHWSNLRS